MRSYAKRTATATAAVEHPSNNLTEFRPRASSLGLRAVLACGLTRSEERVARWYCDKAGFATAVDSGRWKTSPGEVFVRTGPTTAAKCAAELRLAERTVRNLRGRISRKAGWDVRQCDPIHRALVIVDGPIPDASRRPRRPMPIGSATGSATGSAHKEPGSVPQRAVPQQAPERRRCGECGHSWPARYPGGCGKCAGKARKAKADEQQRAEAAQRVIDAVDRATWAEEQRQSAAIVAGTQATFDLDAYQRAADKALALAQAITATHRRTA